MNEQVLHDLLAKAYNLIAAELRSAAPDFDRVMDAVGRLFDPKGAFNTPTMTLSLPPAVDRAVIDLREVMERFRDAAAESTEEAVRDVWSVLSRPEVVAALKKREAFGAT
ncbi:hypothetical protein [Rhodoplanes roseus]|uniref:Uncharacterized protein n=1 Tax=Rhodoplanes roseus TaxID=29409 RepID=A0A327L3V6_9BRAD|nr:hypothetical protein [Rhodoplanes roseus]RAI45087.1 hypothetical protein CH341_05900 [Rhodoplanes roseus]